MVELELEGLHADGGHLVLVGPDGRRYRLAIDDALRAAVRRDRPQLDQLRTAEHPRPRDIQARIRAGATAEEIAEESGLSVQHVRRYEGPVLAEREWVAQEARSIPIGRESDAPSLGDLVVDRLAARGVAPDELGWTAVRRSGEGWELVLTFRTAGKDRQARWSVDLPTRSLHAIDDEGRWLSEVELGPPGARRHLSTVHPRVYDVELDDPAPPAAPVPPAQPEPPADELLDSLRASRGVRQQLAQLDDAQLDETHVEDTSVDDTQIDETLLDDVDVPPPAHPPASAPHEAIDTSVLPLPMAEPSAHDASADEAPAADGRQPARPSEPGRKGRGRSRRTSVPSWDEIVFGAKPE